MLGRRLKDVWGDINVMRIKLTLIECSKNIYSIVMYCFMSKSKSEGQCARLAIKNVSKNENRGNR